MVLIHTQWYLFHINNYAI